MLALFFDVGDQPYAIAARSVVEVAPRVTLRLVPSAPAWLPGVLAYRGTVIPVVDIARRLLGLACVPRLRSRIVVVDALHDGKPTRYGILAERVNGVAQLKDDPGTAAVSRHHGFVLRTLLDEGRLIQLLDIDALCPNAASTSGEGAL